MSKKVLLISQYFLPDINAASFRINDLYLALNKQGFDTTVLTAYPQKSVVEEVKESKCIHRLQIKKVDKKSFINYIRNYFGFMFKTILYTLFRLRKKEYDYVIVTSPPLFVALGGLIISFFKRSKLIIDIRDVWPDSAVSAGMLKSGGMLYRITKIIERHLYKKADIITCVSKPMRNYIYNESNHENIHVLYNGVSNIKKHIKMEKGIMKKDHKKVIIGYAGNIGMVQNIDIILRTCKKLTKAGADSLFEFLIIGDGIERQRMENKAKEDGINNIRFTGPMSKSEVINRLDQVDLLFLSLIEDPVFEKTIPSKLFDYLLNNKPIVTSIKGEGKEILERLGCGLFFHPDDPDSLVRVLKEYQTNPSDYNEAARSNRGYVLNNFNREDMFTRFLEKI